MIWAHKLEISINKQFNLVIIMKKLITFFTFALAFCAAPFLNAQSYYEFPLIKQSFTGWTALPAGWSSNVISGGGVVAGDSIRFTGAGSGGRGGDLVIPNKRDSAVIYVNFDLFIASATVARNNAFGLFLSGSTAAGASTNMGTATYHAGTIASLFLGGTDKKIHLWNMDVKGPAPTSKPDTIVPAFFTGNAFGRPGTTNAICDSINLSTRTNVVYNTGKWYNLTFVMDFNTKKVDVTITQKSDPTNTQTLTGLNFVSSAAIDFARIGLVNTRSNYSYLGVTGPTSVGNGGTVNLNASIDNLYVYQMVKSLGQADVTVQYQDLEGNTIKTARVEPMQEVGVTYALLPSDVVSFADGGNYYAYDATSTGGETVSVVTGGSTIIVKFKKTAITAGDYVWKGTFSEFWNEIDPNLSTDGTNQLGYQPGNNILFNDANAPIKEVTLNKSLNLGTGNITVDVPGYFIKNAAGEILSGTGSIQVNATTKLGLSSKNKMTVYLNKDTLTVNNAELASKYVVKDGTTLYPNLSLGTLIEGTGGTFTLYPSTNSFTNAIKGMNTVNYTLKVKGTAASAGIKGMPRMYCTLDSLTKLNVTTNAGNNTVFATYINYKNNYVNLGDSVLMAYSETPAPTGITYQNIGELSGGDSTKVVGPGVRRVTYRVGSLNTNATFAGILKPLIYDYIAVTPNRTDFDIEKVGKGTWTLSGNSPNFFGTVKVLDGTLKVDGLLCSGTGTYTFGTAATVVNNQIAEVLVTDTATLAGVGSIGALQTTVNGTITGKLTLGGNLSLKPDVGLGGATTIINVNGTDIDKITINGDLYYGGKLKVNVVGDLPPAGDYKILQFNSATESGVNGFDTIELPSADWAFNFTTGTLSYSTTGVNYIDANKEILSVDYYDVTGKKISKDAKGFVIMKVKYTDGTSGSYKTFKKTETR